ncbi:ferrochelatase [Aliarcobacter cryaerophilus]|uniref:ferrochelatase n=1 Tax=Aliarcobacter cryaerophilus TaxID=28198 RepID=UPI0021B61609|nr:ferrochelatase [Aliarcobacter cryaerophilus]MCT7404837.1 ferrochelatase [Aliarcobacter cryaerophilus]MCT7502583.1 ferrochelatase [Aliarcobacter cryaerophilus]
MKRAIVLMNMGGPNNLDEVEVFLKNMFNDKYIIGAPQPIRALIAKLIIYKRLNIAKDNYRKLGGVSPIVGYTKRLVRRLQKVVDADVFYEMRYTSPFAKDVIEKVKHYDEIYAIPMYPHHSRTTTLSSIEDFISCAKKFKIEHKIKTIDYYYDNIFYNKAIVDRIKEALKDDKAEDFELIFSAHGLTQRVIDKGDLYQKHILANVEFVKEELKLQNINFKKIDVAYQSRVGPMKWLQPYMEDKLKELGEKVIIYPISFTVDNSETLGELVLEYGELAKEHGIKDYRVAKAPNSNRNFIIALKSIYENLKLK